MNYLNKRRFSLLLITVLVFSSVQPVLAGQIGAGENDANQISVSHDVSHDHAMSSSAAEGHFKASTMVLDDAKRSAKKDNHCDTSSDSASLCGNCNFCAHCSACIPDLLVMGDINTSIVHIFVTTPLSFLYLSTKDRPPRNA